MKEWKNIDNSNYYESVPYEVQHHYSTVAGISTYYDLEILQDYIFNSKSILEVGACYGRVLDFLSLHKYPGEITAIERSKKFFKMLATKHANFANLINGDIYNFVTAHKFDLIFWLWCGISDFTPKEQPIIIAKLVDLLTIKGSLIVESLSSTEVLTIAGHNDNRQSYAFDVNGATLYGYIPNSEELRSYANAAKANLTIKPYQTPNRRHRQFNIFNRTSYTKSN